MAATLSMALPPGVTALPAAKAQRGVVLAVPRVTARVRGLRSLADLHKAGSRPSPRQIGSSNMRDIARKCAVAALTAGAVLGGLAFPTTASADVSSAQITVCNDSNAKLQFWAKGYNQFNDWDDSPIWYANPHTCATGWNYWWKQNSSIELHYKFAGRGWTWRAEYVPGSSGQTTTFHLS
ncbi:hypothetical protein [Streptomyces sp. NPDC058457]|uniref:hypothetical protein n=1 Tax=Streptomyces sp. NPDC058457 TaxID=3346507 RepID=UPI00365B449F